MSPIEYIKNTAEDEIVAVINHVRALLSGRTEFGSALNPNKCKACRLRDTCDRAKI